MGAGVQQKIRDDEASHGAQLLAAVALCLS
jgi:hypothetical protein